MRKIIIILFSAMLAVIAVGLIIPLFIDVEDYRDEIIAAVEDASGRQFELNGAISLGLIPSPKVSVENIVLKSPDGFRNDDFISAERIDVAVALLPLLSKQVEVRYLDLISPHILLERRNDGEANWVFESQGGDESASGETPELGVKDLRIEGGYIHYLDAVSGADEELQNINARLSLGSLSGPLEMEGTLQARENDIAFGASIGRLDSSESDISLRLGIGDEMLDLIFEGRGNINTRRLAGQLEVDSKNLPQLVRVLSKDAQLNPAFERLSLKTRISLIEDSLSFADMAADVGPNHFEGQAVLDLVSDDGDLALRADLISLDVKGQDPKAVSLPFEALELKSKLKGDAVAIDQLVIALEGGGAAQLNGMWQGGSFKGMLGFHPQDPRRVINAMMPGALEQVPQDRLQSLNYVSALDYEADVIRLQRINMNFDETRLRGAVSVGLEGRPRYRAELTVDQLNVDRYLQAASKPAAESEGQLAAPAVLNDFDADLVLDLARLTFQQNDYRDIAFDGSLSQGIVAINNSRAALVDGGNLQLRGAVRELTTQPRADVTVSGSVPSLDVLAGFSGQSLSKELGTQGPLAFNSMISGTTNDISLDLSFDLDALNAKVQGHLRNIQNDEFRYDLSLDARHKSLASLLAQFDVLDQASAKNGEAVRADIRLRGAKNDLTASGQIASGDGVLLVALDMAGEKFTASVKGAAPDSYAFIKDLGFDYEPDRKDLGALDVDFAIEGADERADIKRLSATLGDIGFKGQGQADLSKDVPFVTLNLTAGLLDFNAFLKEVDTGADAAAEQGSRFRWSEEPFEFSALDHLDGVFTLEAERVIIRAYDVSNAVLKMTSSGRTLAIENLSGDIFGGQLALTSNLDATSTPRLTAQMSLVDVSVEQASRAAASIEPLTGVARFTASIDGAGRSQKALIASLSGQGRFDTQGGVIRRVDIPRINAQFGQLSTVNDFLRLTGSALAGGQTAYRQIGSDIVIQNGILRTNNFTSDIDGGADVSLATTVDLPNWLIDGQGQFRLRDHPDAPPVGVTMTENLSNPTVVYQTKALQQYIGVRLGAAVLKGVVRGEGVGLKDLLKRPKPASEEEAPEEETPQNGNNLQEEQQERAKKPEEQIRDVLLDIFTRKKPN